jgi:hypothetical protein
MQDSVAQQIHKAAQALAPGVAAFIGSPYDAPQGTPSLTCHAAPGCLLLGHETGFKTLYLLSPRTFDPPFLAPVRSKV